MKPEPTHVSTPDIVERLRVGGDGPCDCEILGEAADEIERLRITEIRLRAHIKELKSMDDNDGDEVERLKAALREIADGNGNVDAILVARAALEGKP